MSWGRAYGDCWVDPRGPHAGIQHAASPIAAIITVTPMNVLAQ
jgi:hypothetical protein